MIRSASQLSLASELVGLAPISGSIWQGCQISPLFHEDAQDDQLIYLIILGG
jgi:hypothetical protein